MAYDEREKITKTIRIESVEMTNGRYKIKSTRGETYSFFEESKNTGKTTTAYNQYKALHLGPGADTEIWYAESEGDYQGKPITYRNILTFKPAIGDADGEGVYADQPARRPQPAPAPNGAARTITIDEEFRETDIIGRTATQFLAAAIQHGLSLEEAQSKVSEAVMLAERMFHLAKGPARARLHNRSRQMQDAEAENALAEAREVDWKKAQMISPFEDDDTSPLHTNPQRLAEAVVETIARLDTAQARYEDALHRSKTAERVYKVRRAHAYLKAEGPVAQREAERDLAVDLDFYRFQMADGEASALKEAIITLRGELTAWQSLLSAFKGGWNEAGAIQKYGT